MQIRAEISSDFDDIYQLVESAFKLNPHSDGDEQDLVLKIRASQNYIKELSLVGVLDGKVVGHVMVSKMHIADGDILHDSLVVAPVAIAVDKQRQGLGSQLMREIIEKTRAMGYGHLTLFGDDHFYNRFGFETSTKYGIKTNIPCEEKYCMVMPLHEGALKGIQGYIKYPEYFFN